MCTVPWELLRDEGDISCYVRGISAEGKLTLRTNEENLGTVLSSQEDSVPDTGTPTPDVCLDTAAKLGDLTQLKTSEKTRLVGAINEVKAAADSKQDKLIAGENITIAADGTFHDARIVVSSGRPELDASALRAVAAASGVVRRPDILGTDPIHVSLSVKYQYGLQ